MHNARIRCSRRCVLVLAISFAALTRAPADAAVLFVKTNAIGANDGTSWEDAFAELQSALGVAAAGDEIWVAVGTYRKDFDLVVGTHTGDRTATFQLKSGVALYGGFSGVETTRAERAGLFDQTILTGDLNADDAPAANPADLLTEPTRADNAYHVVTGSQTDETARLDGFTITAGQADGEFPNDGGGGMLNDSGSPTVANCTFHANAAFFGGGMLNHRANPRVMQCLFQENLADDPGGGMYNQFASPIVDGCTFIENVAFGGGGMANVDASTPTIRECTFESNSASVVGGMANQNAGHTTLTRCTFEANSFGGLELLGSPSTLTKCVFRANAGGGAELIDSPSTLTDCRFEENDGDSGGGVFTFGSEPLTFTRCTFERNRARLGGGAYWLASDPTLTECTFRDNLAECRQECITKDGMGGGMYADFAVPVLTKCYFVGNEAHVEGGGLYADGSGPMLIDCHFEGNFAESSGGAIRAFFSSPTIDRCAFLRNATSLERGGGGAISQSNNTVMTITESLFAENAASGAGAVSVGSIVATIDGCVFRGNRAATSDAGAVRVGGLTVVTIRNCTFLQNFAKGDGGALVVHAPRSGASNCVFVGNSAGDTGGAFWGTGVLANCSIVANKAGGVGGGVWTAGALVRGVRAPGVVNCIIWANRLAQTKDEDAQVVIPPDVPSTVVTHTCIEGGWPGSNNIAAVPRFQRMPNDRGDGWGDDAETPEIDEGANDDFGDLRLRSGSPCVDAGTNYADLDVFAPGFQPVPEKDLDGQPRFLDDPDTLDVGVGAPPVVDIGAYEFTLRGDFDFDYDVDLADYLALLSCFRSSGQPIVESCRTIEMDHDDDVDLADLIQFQSAFTGSR